MSGPEEYEDDMDRAYLHIEKQKRQIATLQAEIERLREELVFYADDSNYAPRFDGKWHDSSIETDRGAKARAALNPKERTPMNRDELEIELGRAYRALRGIYGKIAKGQMPDETMLAYHGLTLAAAIRFVNEGALDGSQYFIGKPADVLRDTLRQG